MNTRTSCKPPGYVTTINTTKVIKIRSKINEHKISNGIKRRPIRTGRNPAIIFSSGNCALPGFIGKPPDRSTNIGSALFWLCNFKLNG